MNKLISRLVFAFGLVLILAGRGSAQDVVLTIDWSNLSAVKFTATGNNSYINYNGSLKFEDGIALLNFFTSTVNVQDIGSVTESNLTDSANSPSASSKFDWLSSWNDANPGYYPNNGNGVDLTLWSDSGSTQMEYSTSAQAFYGEAVFDMSGYSSFTNLFPALNSTGNVVIWHGNGTLGTWQVVGAAAVPEPSTYAAILGVVALGFVAWRRRARESE